MKPAFISLAYKQAIITKQEQQPVIYGSVTSEYQN